MGVHDFLQAVVLRGDFLALIEDVRHVTDRRVHIGRQRQRNRKPALHVAGPQAVQPITIEVMREIAGIWHCVQMSTDQDPIGPPQLRAGHDRVAQTHQSQVRALGERGLNQISKHTLVVRLRRHINDRRRESNDVC